MHLMGRSEITTPGNDSFQNEYIRLAGGIPPYRGRRATSSPFPQRNGKRGAPERLSGKSVICSSLPDIPAIVYRLLDNYERPGTSLALEFGYQIGYRNRSIKTIVTSNI